MTQRRIIALMRAKVWQRTILALVVSSLPLGVTGFMHLLTVPQKGSIDPALAMVGLSVLLFINALAWMGHFVRRFTADATAWLAEGRDPTADERDLVFGLPSRMARCLIPLWIPVAITFGGLNIWLTTFNVGRAIAAAILGTFCASLVSLGLVFLWTEEAARPLYAMVLRDGSEHPRARGGVRTSFQIYWLAGSASYIAGILSILVVFASPVHAPAGTVCCILGLAVGFLMTNLAARSVSEPLEKVRAGMALIGAGDLEATIDVDDPGAVGELQAGFNRMAVGLRERQRLSDIFGRHVGAEVARRAMSSEVALDGTMQEVSVLFTDIVASTSLASERTPDAVVAMLNAFFAAVVEAVDAEGGLVNQFQGDGALCIFGAPVPQSDHALRALRATRELHRRLDELRAASPGFDAAIGVSSGLVVAGDIGTPGRHEYTVIGDPVNVASRLCNEAKGTDGRVFVSAETTVRAPRAAVVGWQRRGEIALRGRPAPTVVYEIS